MLFIYAQLTASTRIPLSTHLTTMLHRILSFLYVIEYSVFHKDYLNYWMKEFYFLFFCLINKNAAMGRQVRINANLKINSQLPAKTYFTGKMERRRGKLNKYQLGYLRLP